jgi:hypothetical protein
MSQKSFILHQDSLVILEKMTDEQAGKFIKILYYFKKTGELQELDFAMEMATTPFFNQFKRDKIKYNNVCEARKLAGSKGGKQKVANASKCKQKVANLAENDNDSDNDNENDSKKEEGENFQIFWNKYDYKKSRSKSEASFKTALKKESFENIIAGLENYIKNRGTDPKFWKHPTTWLNSESWSDEYKTKKDNHNNFKKQDYKKGTGGFNVY